MRNVLLILIGLILAGCNSQYGQTEVAPVVIEVVNETCAPNNGLALITYSVMSVRREDYLFAFECQNGAKFTKSVPAPFVKPTYWISGE